MHQDPHQRPDGRVLLAGQPEAGLGHRHAGPVAGVPVQLMGAGQSREPGLLG
jgi:hypothetical protein